MARRNYHNARENKRLVSQRTSQLMGCQLVSEAAHSLPFQRRQTEKGGQNRAPKMMGRRDKQDNAV